MTTRDKVLRMLSGNQGTYSSGEEIAQALQVSRAAVWKAVKTLRQEGYAIDAQTNKGYCLSPDTDILSSQGIRQYLNPACRTLDLTVLPSAGSTNALLREKANRGFPEGTVVIANGQTEGRGRYGRSFYSPPETGIYLSILLRPVHHSPRQAVCLTAAAAAAMCQAIEEVSGERPQIKWVNDIILRGKKVCGILTEGAFGLESGTLEYAVLGAGINVYPPKEGFPPELESIAGAVFEQPGKDLKNRLAAAFLNRFLDFYADLGSAAYLEDYRSRSLAVGQTVTLLSGGKTVRAYAYGIDDDCRLLVRYENGDTAALSYGEITLQTE